MERERWPAPIRTLRGVLPAEMRVLRGAVGALGGAFLFGSVLVILIGGNWQLGYGDDRILVGIFLVLIPAGLGVVSPVWYWLGRPVWHWVDRPGVQRLRPFHGARFLPGLVGSVLGVALIVPVSATSRLLEQTLAPFGLAIAIGAPLWYWLVRPTGVVHTARWLPGVRSGSTLAARAVRTLSILGVLFAASLAITAVIALPVVGLGDPVTAGGLSVTVTDTHTVADVAEIEGEEGYGRYSWQLLLVRVSVENQGATRQRPPGMSAGDITVIAPACSAQNFGEPSNNCNQAFVDGRFRANGTTYANYETRLRSAGGTLGPGDRITGWLVFRLESRPTQSAGVKSMVIVDDVGRWTLRDETW